jgi:MarR family transcriptional regulator for hemolysin
VNSNNQNREKVPETQGVDLSDSVKWSFRNFFHQWIFLQMKFIREEGLAIPQLFTLRFLYYNKPKDLSTLADFMGVSKPTITGIMNTLEKEGFVKREHGVEDRRRIDMVLTQKSLDLFTKFESLTTYILDELVASCPENSLENLNRTLVALSNKLKDSIHREF